MAEQWVPIWQTVGTAYGLGLRSILRFPLSTIAVSAASLVIDSYITRIPVSSVVATQLLFLLGSFLNAAVLAPFAILIHRAIILHDYTGTYWTMGAHRRARQFVTVALLLVFVQDLAGFLSGLDRYSGWFVVPGFICVVASIVFWIRLCLAFPAIATDSSNAAVRDSFRYVRGSGLAIFFVFLFLGLCWAPIGIPLFFADRLSFFADNPVPLLALQAVQQVAATAVFAVYVAAASQLWKTRADWSAAAAAPTVATV